MASTGYLMLISKLGNRKRISGALPPIRSTSALELDCEDGTCHRPAAHS